MWPAKALAIYSLALHRKFVDPGYHPLPAPQARLFYSLLYLENLIRCLGTSRPPIDI